MSDHIQFQVNIDDTARELKELLVEAEFGSRWMLIEAYHTAGKMVIDLYETPDNPMSKEELVQTIAGKISKGERMLWYAAKFYELYPDLNGLPEGKNIGWNKVVTKYLSSPKEEGCGHEDREQITFEVCKGCGKRLGKIDN